MKTSVSIPNAVFRAAEALARRTHRSRSQLYAAALSEFLARHEVTDAMNRVVDQLTEAHDPFVTEAARRILERSDW